MAVRKTTGQKIMSVLGPMNFVVATRKSGGEAGFVTEPLMTKPVELRRTDVQPLRRRKRS